MLSWAPQPRVNSLADIMPSYLTVSAKRNRSGAYISKIYNFGGQQESTVAHRQSGSPCTMLEFVV